jgi:hypothetical protein
MCPLPITVVIQKRRSAQQRGLTLESLTLEILADSMETQPETLLKAGMSHEVWSPYDAFDAAVIMTKALRVKT